MKKNPKRLSAGFSLIEVIIALVILSVSMISVAKFQTNVFKNNSLAKQRTEATMIAQGAIEEYRQLFSKGTATAATAITALKNTTSATGGNTTYTVNVDDATALDKGDIQLNLSVSWRDQDSSNNSIALTSIVSAQQYSESSLALKGEVIPVAPTTEAKPRNSCVRLKNSNYWSGSNWKTWSSSYTPTASKCPKSGTFSTSTTTTSTSSYSWDSGSSWGGRDD